MASATMSSFDKWFKAKYWDTRRQAGFEQAFWRSHVLLNKLRRAPVDLRGEKIYIPVHSATARVAAPRAESADLPTAAPETVKRYELTPVALYCPISITGWAIVRSQGNENAFTPAMNFEVVEKNKTLRDLTNRQLYGQKKGELATVAVTANSTTVYVDDPTGLSVGQSIVIAAVANGTIITDGAQEILTVSTTPGASGGVSYGGSFTVTAAVNVTASTHAVYPLGGAAAATSLSYNNAIGGLKQIVSATIDWGGATRASDIWSQGNVFSAAASGGVLTHQAPDEDTVMMISHCVQQFGGQTNLILTHPRQYRALAAAAKKGASWINPVPDPEFGYENMTIRGIGGGTKGVPVSYDLACQPDRMYFLDTRSLWLGEADPLGFMDHDGQTWRAQSGKDVYDAMLRVMLNLCCSNPAAQAVITDLPLGTTAY